MPQDVIIGLTILAYRYSGLRQQDFKDLIDAVTTEFTQEVGPAGERPSNLRYVAWVQASGGRVRGRKSMPDNQPDDTPQQETDDSSKEVVSLKYLQTSNAEQLDKLFTLWQTQPLTIHYYLNRFIFPEHTRAQQTKFSASGQEVGGDALVGRRVGFSGTPSDMLPLELGKCDYEQGDDGKMLTTMLRSDVVSYEALPDNWQDARLPGSTDGYCFRDVEMILQQIAQSHHHAMIDTGALITGYTNQEVATKLLDLGLPWCDGTHRPLRLFSLSSGVVFLNDEDQQKVLVRASGRVVDSDQCGISLDRRFAFYGDLISMDHHLPNCFQIKYTQQEWT